MTKMQSVLPDVWKKMNRRRKMRNVCFDEFPWRSQVGGFNSLEIDYCIQFLFDQTFQGEGLISIDLKIGCGARQSRNHLTFFCAPLSSTSIPSTRTGF